MYREKYRLVRYMKATALVLGFLLTSSCSVGVPSPLKTGSWYYGEIDKDHIGFDIVFPWVEHKPQVKPKVDEPE